MKYYAGIGSRKTPPRILSLMTKIGVALWRKGYILRSGGAEGADQAFAQEVPSDAKEIYAPWYKPGEIYDKYALEEAMLVASTHHPNWSRLSDPAKKLMGRNVFQLLGLRMTFKSQFVVCWTPDGATLPEHTSPLTGGTGQAIRMAQPYDIPVFNMAREDHYERIVKLVAEDMAARKPPFLLETRCQTTKKNSSKPVERYIRSTTRRTSTTTLAPTNTPVCAMRSASSTTSSLPKIPKKLAGYSTTKLDTAVGQTKSPTNSSKGFLADRLYR